MNMSSVARAREASLPNLDGLTPVALALAAFATTSWQLMLRDGSTTALPSETEAPAPAFTLAPAAMGFSAPEDFAAKHIDQSQADLPVWRPPFAAEQRGGNLSQDGRPSPPAAQASALPSPVAIRLDARPFGWRPSGQMLIAPLHAAPEPRAGKSALEGVAEDLAPDWRAPLQRDVSLFVATDDEALSWSFSQSSPNFGRLVYQEDRVDFGRFSAGVAVQQADASLAVAYLEEDAPSRFGVDTSERYVGVLMTYRR